MTSPRTISRIQSLIWVLIYGGLLCAVLGFATRPSAPATGWSMMVVGALVTAAGVVLIWVRSRMAPDS
ncbi:MAG: hypothetical protein HYX47_14300 [Burkholderiales bacterium]|nr:hypothetical protein [Burkholderiales bacterium]